METNEITALGNILGHLLVHNSTSETRVQLQEVSQITVNRAKEAHRFLVSDKTLCLTPVDSKIHGITAGDITDDMPVGIATAVAMRNLDELVYFVMDFEFLNLKNNEFYIACMAIHEEVSESKLFHRLIPMNAYRAKMLESIREDERFLFPWYETWVEKDPLTWWHYQNHMAGEGDYRGDTALNEVVLNDEPFYDQLVAGATLIREIPQIIAEDHVYYLLKEADKIACASELPDIIVKAGRVDAAVRVAVEDIQNGVPSEKWRVEAALFGMGLTEGEREQVLRPIFEDGRKDMDTKKLTQCLTDMVRRLEEVSVRGFRLLEDPHRSLYHLLTTCEDLKFVARAVTEWDQR